MPIVIQCPNCGQHGEVSRGAAGFSVTCDACGRPFPVPVGAGHLTVEWGVGAVGTRVLLTPGVELRIGRAADNELVIPGERVSRHHAVLRWEEDGWRLHDLGSANGTLLNGRAIKSALVDDGSHFTIGDFVIRVAIAGAKAGAEQHLLDELAAQESRYLPAGLSRSVPHDVLASPPHVNSKADTQVFERPPREEPMQAVPPPPPQPAPRGGVGPIIFMLIILLAIAAAGTAWLVTR